MIFTLTGANGFVGVHIIHHLLRNGHCVRAIIRPGASLSEFEKVKSFYNLDAQSYSRLEWHECVLYDILGLDQIIHGSDYVMHLAGLISYLQRDYDTMLRVNQVYTANVVNVCLSSGIKKLLYCSSIAAISKNDEGNLIKEDIEWDNEIPHSNYGYTKHLGENEIWRGREEGLSVVTINPGIILGYGDWNKGSNKLFKNAATKFPFYSEGVTGWVGVEDVAKCAIELCLSEISGERFILITENKSYRNVAYSMAEAFGVKPPKIEVQGLLYKLAYSLVWLKELLGLGGMLSKETVKASVARNRFDNSKVKNTVSFDLEPINAVIAKAVKHYK